MVAIELVGRFSVLLSKSIVSVERFFSRTTVSVDRFNSGSSNSSFEGGNFLEVFMKERLLLTGAEDMVSFDKEFACSNAVSTLETSFSTSGLTDLGPEVIDDELEVVGMGLLVRGWTKFWFMSMEADRELFKLSDVMDCGRSTFEGEVDVSSI